MSAFDESIPENYSLFQCMLLQKNQILTNAAKLSLLQSTRVSLYKYLSQFNTLRQLKAISFKSLIRSILNTPIQKLCISVFQNQVPSGSSVIYIIWDKKALRYKELYRHLVQHLHLSIVFGGNSLYQCIAGIVLPMNIVKIEKQNGEYIKTIDEVQFESSIRVYCRNIKEEKAIEARIPLSLKKDKLNATEASLKRLLTVITFKSKSIYSKRELLSSMSNVSKHLKITTPLKESLSVTDLSLKSPSSTNASNVDIHQSNINSYASLNMSPHHRQRLSPLSFTKHSLQKGGVNYVNLKFNNKIGSVYNGSFKVCKGSGKYINIKRCSVC